MNKFILSALIFLSLASCQKDQNIISDYNTDKDIPNIQENEAQIKGLLNVKLSYEIIDNIDTKKNELTVPTGSSELDELLDQLNATGARRVFPYAGRHESRQVDAGLNRWYTLKFDASRQARSNDLVRHSPFVDYYEGVYRPILNNYKITKARNIKERRSRVSPFNDPLFHKQWNMHNDGSVGIFEDGDKTIYSSTAGADINIVPAWQESVGDPSVIVSIVDGGIDINHEDLINNLWVNEGEIPGNGIDDDNNGYIDDVNGYNFVDNNGVIIAHDHGTHVAGVIAATNNNGIGVSSIAGGDGSSNTGVKVMSCQIFKPNPNYDPEDPDSEQTLTTETYEDCAAGIVYGANNGSLISQNSWGYGPFVKTPKVIAEAIQYFRNNAGMNTPQPLMKGGVVIFAAGNDEMSYESAPSADPGVISVCSYAPDFAASWFTNYGSWVSIAAPGGWMALKGKYGPENGEFTSAILSTTNNNGYGYMQGTSMACPHVSGIAALILSKYGSNDFTSQELTTRLLSGVKPINPNSYISNKHQNGFGRGFADALIALEDLDMTMTPATPMFIEEKTEVDYSSIKLTFGASSFEIDKKVELYRLYFSEKELTIDNYNKEDSEIYCTELISSFYDQDEEFSIIYSRLEHSTRYYCALEATSRNGNTSGPVFYEDGITTTVNLSPIITVEGEDCSEYTIAGNDQIKVRLKVEDPDNHYWDFDVNHSTTTTYKRDGDYIDLTVTANRFHVGKYTITTTVRDEHEGEASYSFNVIVVKDAYPTLIDKNKSFDVALSHGSIFDLNEFFTDEDISSLTYTLDSVSHSNLDACIEGNKLVIKPRQKGYNEITIAAIDKHLQKSKYTIPAFVYDNPGIYSIFPTIAESVIYIKVGPDVDGDMNFVIRNVNGEVAMRQKHNTNDISAEKRTVVMNIANLFPGKYYVTLSNNGSDFKDSFVKK